MLITENGTAVGRKKVKHIRYLESVKLGGLRKRLSHFDRWWKLTPVPEALLVALPEDPPLLLRRDVLHAHWRLHMQSGDSWTEWRSVRQMNHESSIKTSRVAKSRLDAPTSHRQQNSWHRLIRDFISKVDASSHRRVVLASGEMEPESGFTCPLRCDSFSGKPEVVVDMLTKKSAAKQKLAERSLGQSAMQLALRPIQCHCSTTTPDNDVTMTRKKKRGDY